MKNKPILKKIFKFVIFWSSEYQVDALSPFSISQKKVEKIVRLPIHEAKNVFG